MEAIENQNSLSTMKELLEGFGLLKQIHTILVPFSNDEASMGALNYASMIASIFNANIVALHLADPKDYRSKSEFQEKVTQMVEFQLKPRLKEIQSRFPKVQKIKLQYLGIDKPIHDHIVSFVKEHDIDLVVMRSHGLPKRRDFEIHFKKSITYQVVLECPCPVFTFTEIPQRASAKNILVPVDLSDGSLQKIPLVIEMAGKCKSKVHLLSAVENKEDRSGLLEQMQEVGEIISAAGVKEVSQEIVDQSMLEAINEYVTRHEIDLIVVMSKPGFKWSDLWISPKAKRLIMESKVPVLSIRPPAPARH